MRGRTGGLLAKWRAYFTSKIEIRYTGGEREVRHVALGRVKASKRGKEKKNVPTSRAEKKKLIESLCVEKWDYCILDDCWLCVLSSLHFHSMKIYLFVGGRGKWNGKRDNKAHFSRVIFSWHSHSVLEMKEKVVIEIRCLKITL